VPAALLLEEGLPPEALFGELLLAALQLRGLSIALVVKALLPHFRNAQLPHTPNQSIPMQKTVYQHGTMFAVKRYPPCSICNLTTNGALTRPVRIGRPSMDCAQGARNNDPGRQLRQRVGGDGKRMRNFGVETGPTISHATSVPLALGAKKG